MFKRFVILHITAVIICSMFITGCDKNKECENTKQLTGNIQQLAGSWEWVKTFDDCKYYPILSYKTPQSVGYTISLTFLEEGRYVKYKNGDKIEEGGTFHTMESSVTPVVASFHLTLVNDKDCKGYEVTYGSLLTTDTLVLTSYPFECSGGDLATNYFVRK